MAKNASDTMSVRVRCCQCGRVDRLVAPARSAFTLADGLLSVPCPGGRRGPCNSRDRRLDVRPARG